MPTFTIKSRIHGEQTFWMQDGGGYIRLEYGNKTGTLAQQICYGGSYSGNTIKSTPEQFENDCRKWWRQYLENERENGVQRF